MNDVRGTEWGVTQNVARYLWLQLDVMNGDNLASGAWNANLPKILCNMGRTSNGSPGGSRGRRERRSGRKSYLSWPDSFPGAILSFRKFYNKTLFCEEDSIFFFYRGPKLKPIGTQENITGQINLFWGKGRDINFAKFGVYVPYLGHLGNSLGIRRPGRGAIRSVFTRGTTTGLGINGINSSVSLVRSLTNNSRFRSIITLQWLLCPENSHFSKD